MKKIEIYVACHKPSEIPNNSIFIPIHVGAKQSKIVLSGLQRDDEGDNISTKNPQYCEMTAQYWAWKHSQADYIGLCHYRRYLNFTDKLFTNYTTDNRKQVLIPILNPYTEEKYGLLDAHQIHKIVENNDVLVANAQDLSKVNTPYGPQKTTLKHWLAHDMALINVKDLYTLFEIVERDYPDIYKSMRKYLNTKYFYGFNTFVLRRDLFNEMCSFEFDVLSKLEKKVDISHYNQQLSRIYGFMGEILFSSFVYHLQRTRKKVKIKECQMLYFEETTPVVNLQSSNNYLTYVFDGTYAPEFLLFPTIKSFLNNIRKDKKYELILLHENWNLYYKNYFKSFIEKYDNVLVKFLDLNYFIADSKEKYKKLPVYPSAFLAWMLPNHTRCVYLHWNTIIKKNLDTIFECIKHKKMIAAVKDIYYQGRLNTFYQDEKVYAERILKIRDIFSIVNPHVLLINLDLVRTLSINCLVKKALTIQENSERQLREEELLNTLYQDQISFLDATWNVLIRSNEDIRFYCNEAPLQLNNAQKSAVKDASIITYHPDAPWFIDKDENFYLQYWQLVKGSELEEIFRNHLAVRTSTNKLNAKQITWAYIDTLLPKGSKRRERIKKIFPKKGIIYKQFKKIMNP